MTKLHITQCEDGTWMMSFESENGELERITSHHLTPHHLEQDAHESVKEGKYPGAIVIVEALRSAVALEAFESTLEEEMDASVRPSPRRVAL